MKFTKEFTDFLLGEAKYYKKGLLVSDVLPILKGKKIDEETVKGIINPFLISISNMLSPGLKAKFDSYLDEFVPLAVDYMYVNPDMHEGNETCLINEAKVSALLITFISFSCDLPNIKVEDLMINELN